MKHLFFTLLGLSSLLIISCEKPNTNNSTNPSNPNITFFIEYNIDGEKIRYEVDTVDMYQNNLYPNNLTHYTIYDNLNFGGSYTGSLIKGYMNDLEILGSPFLLNPFGENKASFPKIGFLVKIPYFSTLILNKSIDNDTITPANGINSSDKFVAHLTKYTHPFILGDTSTYQSYEAGIISIPTSSGLDPKKINIKPTPGILTYKTTKSQQIKYKWNNMIYNVTQLDGEFSGKMRKYSISSNQIIYNGYVNVNIKFSLPLVKL